MGVYKIRFQGQNPKGKRVTTQDLINAKSEAEARSKAEYRLPQVQAMLEERDGCQISGLFCSAVEDKTFRR